MPRIRINRPPEQPGLFDRPSLAAPVKMLTLEAATTNINKAYAAELARLKADPAAAAKFLAESPYAPAWDGALKLLAEAGEDVPELLRQGAENIARYGAPLNEPLNVNPGLRAPDSVEPPRTVRTRIARGTPKDSSGSAGSGAGNDPGSVPSGAEFWNPAQPDETKPFSHFTQSPRLSADEAMRALRGQSLGYTGVWFMRTRAAVCRDCHQDMIAGTAQYIPRGFDGQGPMAVIYNCQQRKPNVEAKCGVCGNPTIGEVVGPNGV